jgi:hypothetical protein
MIIGVHTILYSKAAEETRKALAAILKSRTVDAGGGWPIMALPPAEIAVHPTGGKAMHEIWLLCDDLDQTIAELATEKIFTSGAVHQESWGRRTAISLPGGEFLGLYEPSHPNAFTRKRAAKGTRRTTGRGTASR